MSTICGTARRWVKGLSLVIGVSASVSPTTALAGSIFFGPDLGEHENRLPRFPILCLTDHQLRQRIATLGFSDIYLNAPTGRTVQARASRGNWVYLLELNHCSGDLLSWERLRPR